MKISPQINKILTRMIKLVILLFSMYGMVEDSSDHYFKGDATILTDYKQLLVDIREMKMSPDQARDNFRVVLKKLKETYPSTYYDSASVNIVFPLRGSNYQAVGGYGKGFYAKYFDLFDHSVKRSHPAHDIFIRDANRDCINDYTKTYTDVLSVSDGLVLATETNWQPGSEYRGGNYIWIYDTSTGGLWYYAHQREVFVVPGQIVTAGTKIGEVGRTGFNAAAPRSGTHLHIMYLHVDENGDPHAINTYNWLKTAQTNF